LSVNFQNEKFDQYFFSIYKERWSLLFESLKNNEIQVLRKNKYVDNDYTQSFELYCLKIKELDKYCNFYQVDSKKNVHNFVDNKGIHVFYKMDPASCIVAYALGVNPDETILDMCAAPGGKSLILAEALNGTGELILNEYSNSRRERLMHVVRDYIPHEYRQNIFVSGKDGNYYGLNKKEAFDRILVDAPCSGERHLLENSKEFLDWTKRRSENLAIRQYSLLSSAYLACRVNGQLVYSTCSISPLENDHVVAKLIKKRSVEIVRLAWLEDISFIEKTEYGYQILPDKCGFGPMYFSVIVKKN